MIHQLGSFRKSCIYIWLTLVLSVLLCGMCVEKVYADSSLCLSASERAELMMPAQEYDIVQEDLRQAEILVQQTDITPIRNTKRESLRIILRILMNLMFVAMLPQILLLSSEIMEKRDVSHNSSHDFIICFIHQKDGEKDCLFV